VAVARHGTVTSLRANLRLPPHGIAQRWRCGPARRRRNKWSAPSTRAGRRADRPPSDWIRRSEQSAVAGEVSSNTQQTAAGSPSIGGAAW